MKALPIRLIYFGFNFPPDFIAKVWEDTPHLISHFNETLSHLYQNYGVGLVFFKFFIALSTDNQEKLINWIDLNYKG